MVSIFVFFVRVIFSVLRVRYILCEQIVFNVNNIFNPRKTTIKQCQLTSELKG